MASDEEYAGAQALADFAAQYRLEESDPSLMRHAKLVVRDTLGTVIAGSQQPENAGFSQNASHVGAPGRSTVVGNLNTVSPHVAALINATTAVSVELDEGCQYATNHPAVHVLPAALAVAEDVGASGHRLLECFIAGYEVTARLGAAMSIREPVHPFGTVAVVGAAVASALLRDLRGSELRDVIELAAGMAIASSQTAANSGASVRNLGTGLTAHNGVLATALFEYGYRGEPGALERVFGNVLGSAWDLSPLKAGLQSGELYIQRNYFKLHACSRWNHAPVDAAAVLMQRSDLRVGDIVGVDVYTYDPATRLSGSTPRNGYAAKHSIPFNVAARLLWDSNDLDVYTDDAVARPELVDLASRISVHEDPSLTALLPHVRAGRVEIRTRDGRTLVEQVDRPRGGFDNPFSRQELDDKFMRLSSRGLDERAVAELDSQCERLEHLASVVELTSTLQLVDVR